MCYKPNATGFEFHLQLDSPLGISCPVDYETISEMASADTEQNLYDKLVIATLEQQHVRCKSVTTDEIVCRPRVLDPFNSECAPWEIRVKRKTKKHNFSFISSFFQLDQFEPFLFYSFDDCQANKYVSYPTFTTFFF